MELVDRADCLARLEASPVAHLATVRPDGAPHIVPITFAIFGDQMAHMVDYKPKRSDRLQRLANVAAHPGVSVLVDHYADDWSQLWWVRIDGPARVTENGPDWEAARAALTAKYEQYELHPPQGPAVLIMMESVSGWAAADPPR